MELGRLFLLFMIYSFIGWIIEVVGKLIELKRFVNRGFLIGPYLPIYGFAGIIMTLTLTRYYDNPIGLFFMSIVICGVLEYVTSFVLEKVFNARWWDYTRYKFNINGRVCLETMIPFGFLGCILMYVIFPFLNKIIITINPNFLNIFVVVLMLIFVVDIIISCKVLFDFRFVTTQFNNRDNTEEITKKVKEFLTSKSILNKRLINSFPNVVSIIENIKREVFDSKLKLFISKEDLKKVHSKFYKVKQEIKNKIKNY